MSQLTLELPYEEIGEVAPRRIIRTFFKPVASESYLIPYNKIEVRDNFNRREFKGIRELANSIAVHGITEELEVDILLDGTVKLEQGERRYKAYRLLIEEGVKSETDLLPCWANPKEKTEQERDMNIWVSNMFRQDLHPLDQATRVYRQKFLFSEKPLSSEDLGKMLGISRSSVDNLLIIHAMPDDLKDQIRNEILTPTAALNLVKQQKKLGKQTDSEEEKSHITSMGETPLPKDPMKEELKELDALNLQAERQQQQEAEFERKEQERLERDAILVDVVLESLEPHFGKRLAANAIRYWTEDFVKEETGEIVTIDAHEIIMKQGVVINEMTAADLVTAGIEKVWIFREITTSASVITEPVAGAEKAKFDTDREEIALCQNIIKNVDWISVHAEKLEPAQTGKDFSQRCDWIQKDMELLRDWVNKNKKQNKLR